MFGKAWMIAKEVAIGILLVLSLWLVIGGAYKKDIGNLSDWISAACNLLMALTALFVANEAKKWFEQKARLNNLDAAHKLALEFENALWEINSRLYSDSLFRKKILTWIEYKDKTSDEIQIIVLREAERITGSDLDELAFIYNCQLRLARFNVFPSNALVEMLATIKIERDHYLNAHYSYLLDLANYYASNVDGLVPTTENIDKVKKKLAETFELNLAKRSIGKDYFFL